MSAPKTLDEAIKAIAELNTKFDASQADLEAAQALAEEADQAKATAEAELATSREAQTKAEEKLADTEGKLQAATKRADDAEATVATLKAEAKTAEQRAAEICAAAGVEPIATDPKKEEQNGGSLMEQYQAIKDPEARAKFLEENKDALHKENRS